MQTNAACLEQIARLPDFLAARGELDAAWREKIERHLAECPSCHTGAQTVQTMGALYRGALRELPRADHARLLEMLARAGANKKGRSSERP